MQIKLGQNIRALRRRSGMTQEQMAEALGVSAGAIYKWESEKSSPELEMLVDIAQLFEVSVDALLDYGWEKEGMGQMAERLKEMIRSRKPEEGMRYGEKALKKYPNSFEVVYRCAQIYFFSMEPGHLLRAVELFRKSLDLIDQNTDERISASTIQNYIAYCYCELDRMDDAIEILRRNNADGVNEYRIGLLLAQAGGREDEALERLSNGLLKCYEELHNICVGFANAYAARGQMDRVTELVTLVYELGQGLRDGVTPSCVDWCNMKLLLILVETELSRGNRQGARERLLRARDTARWIDSGSGMETGAGLRFYHGSGSIMAFDDAGVTAMEVIRNFAADAGASGALRELWKQMEQEGSI